MTQENSTKKRSASIEKSDVDSNQSLGAYLQRERQKKQLTIKEVADATRIRPESLEALEAGNKNLLPVSVFTKGFVKIYAAHLGLNEAEILERFSTEWGSGENKPPEILSCETMAESSPLLLSLRFYFLLFLIALLASLAYFFFQADISLSPIAVSTVTTPSKQLPAQVDLGKNEVKQLEIPAVTPPQETLLISPQSAGKIPFGEDEPPTHDLHDQEKTTSNAATFPTPPKVNDDDAEMSRPQPQALSSVNLHIRFIKRSRISITEDEGLPEEYIFATGEESTWQATKYISLKVDDPEAVELTLNGSPISIEDSNNNDSLAITLPTDIDR